MDRITDIALHLVRCAIGGETPNKNLIGALTQQEFLSLYQLCTEHDIAGLVGNELQRCSLLPDGAVKNLFSKQMSMAFFRCEKQSAELARIETLFDAEGIDCIPLKGSVIRPLYPTPWLRTSSDIDILIRSEDEARACAALIEKLSYRTDERTVHDVNFYSPGGVHVELHYRLYETAVGDEANAVLQNVWDHAVSVGGCRYALQDGMLLYYHFVHMAHHFLTGGCGVRPLADLWLMEKTSPTMRQDAAPLLTQSGLDRFAEQMEALARVWFGDGVRSDLTDDLEAYLISGGIYGSPSAKVSMESAQREGKLSYWLHRIWRPSELLKSTYPVLRRYPVLIPLYQVRRWVCAPFNGKWRRVAQEMNSTAQLSKEESARMRSMLDALGIK